MATASIGMIEPVKVLRCDPSPDSPKMVDLVVQFQNGHWSELHLSPDLTTVRKMIAALGSLEQALVDDLPPEQGQYILHPGGGKP